MAYGLAAWFDIPADLSGPTQDEAREEILMQASQATIRAEHEECILLRCPKGRVMLHAAEGTPLDDDNQPLVMIVEFVEKGHWARRRFWMNTSSIRSILDAVASLPQVDFNTLFCTEES
jgi:hypothetical protein